MSIEPFKKDEEKGFTNRVEEEQDDFLTENERTPEFDEIGTALNEI